MIFKRKLQPPRWRLGFSRRFPWLAYCETDYALAMRIVGTVNKRPWRGYDAGTCLVTGVSIKDGEVTFTIEHKPHGTNLVFLVDGTVRSFKVYRQLDFNKYDLGTCVPGENMKTQNFRYDTTHNLHQSTQACHTPEEAENIIRALLPADVWLKRLHNYEFVAIGPNGTGFGFNFYGRTVRKGIDWHSAQALPPNAAIDPPCAGRLAIAL